MANQFIVVCASVLLIQAVVGHIIPLSHPVSGSAAASSAASAAAAKNAAAVSAAAASAAATRGGGAGSAAASSAASAAAARNAASARGASSAAAANAAAAASAGSTRGLLSLADYDITYSEPLLVKSTSGIYPTGLSVSSDIGLEGLMYVYGSLPFLSTVGFEDSLQTDGSGVATCGCGSDNIGITNEI